MALARNLRDLPKQPSTTATYPSLFRDVISDYLLAERDAEGELPMAGPTARIRHSWAGMCARRIGYSVTGAEGEPFDAESLWSFALGHKAHEIVQAAFTKKYGDRAQIEMKVDLGERACTIDLLLTFENPEPFDVDGVTYLCKVVAVELKSTGGYSWTLQVKQEGPKTGAYLQGAMNAAAVDADLMVVGYLALDRQTKTAKILYGDGRQPLDAVWATWAYPRALYLPDAEAEARRLGRVLEAVDAGRLPGRRIPELPKGAEIVDPSDGRWEIRVDGDDGPQIVQSGNYWGCGYCQFQRQCVADAEVNQ